MGKKARITVGLIIVFIIGFSTYKVVKGRYIEENRENYASKYIYLYDIEKKEAIIEKSPKGKAYPASLTKIMTVLVALEQVDDISKVAPIDVDSYRKMVELNASMAGFYGNEPVTYRDLLYGTMLSSGGEAANSLGINISGNTNSFVKLMNDKAKEIGLRNTNFTNLEGLHDENQYTTAEDMGKLVNYALENEDFRAIFTKENFNTTSTKDHPGGVYLSSTVLGNIDPAEENGFKIIGGKSGTTLQAGECWATLGIKDDREYICIVLGAEMNSENRVGMLQKEDTLKLFGNIGR